MVERSPTQSMKPNYAFAKRQRELAKKQKKEAKKQRAAELAKAAEPTGPVEASEPRAGHRFTGRSPRGVGATPGCARRGPQ